MKRLFIVFINSKEEVEKLNTYVIESSDIPNNFNYTINSYSGNTLNNLNSILKYKEDGWIFFTLGDEFISTYLIDKLSTLLYANSSDVITLPKSLFVNNKWVNRQDPNYQTRICKISNDLVFKNKEKPTIYNYKSETILQEREYSLYEIK